MSRMSENPNCLFRAAGVTALRGTHPIKEGLLEKR